MQEYRPPSELNQRKQDLWAFELHTVTKLRLQNKGHLKPKFG